MGSSVSLIACVGKNGELGYKGDLCFRLREDMQLFKECTIGHTVVMGRKTFESLARPLPYRDNIIITHKPIEGIQCSESVPFILGFLRGQGKTVFVIGGASIYEQALPFADRILLTEIDKESPADVFFPQFDKDLYDKTTLKAGEENGIKYKIVEYRRNG